LKTDNSHFEEKVRLRIDHLPEKNHITVLDCFAGTGKLWDEVKKRTKKDIKVLSIEKEHDKNPLALSGSNLKYINAIDLSRFDLIDLDAYGIPYRQLSILFQREYKGGIFVTAIQSCKGMLPNQMIIELGYTKSMIQKIPSLFNREGLGKIKNYLYLHGVQSITGYFIERKSYFYFKTKAS
jgi:hypothetical protein